MLRVSSRGAAFAAALLLAGCSQGPGAPSAVTSPTAATTAGAVSASATGASGDVIVGNGPLEFVRLRMDRQTSTGASILRQYALPGQTYQMEAGETIELWAEWVSPTNPRMYVNWGEGEADWVNCGSCLMKHTYRRAGTYIVSVKLDDRVSTTITRTFTLNAAAVTAESQQFCSAEAITIPDSGKSSPYPSSINVSGVSGRVSEVTATFRGFSHTYDYDVYAQLRSPGEQALMLMNDTGDDYLIDNTNITFRDGAPTWTLADKGPGSYTFAPAGGSNDDFEGPFGSGFSTFAGSDPNGTWNLYVQDQAGGDEGQIAGGWCVNITTTRAASVGEVVQAGSAGASANALVLYPNSHILNSPNRKPRNR